MCVVCDVCVCVCGGGTLYVCNDLMMYTYRIVCSDSHS